MRDTRVSSTEGHEDVIMGDAGRTLQVCLNGMLLGTCDHFQMSIDLWR